MDNPNPALRPGRILYSAAILSLCALGCAQDPSAASPTAAPSDTRPALPAIEPPDPPALAGFRQALEQQAFDRLPEVLADLEAADEDRSDPDLTLALALANLWGVVEAGREPGAPAMAPARALAARAGFERARELSPDDARIDGWLGSVLLGTGRALGSAALIEQGFAEVERGVTRNPQFNAFVLAFQHAEREPADPRRAEAPAEFWRAATLCDPATSAEHPSLPPGERPEPFDPRVCNDTARAPHNLEGFWLHGGDIMLQAGDLAAAHACYQNAITSDVRDDWPFRALADERLEAAEARLQLLQDDDPNNDPTPIWRAQIQCASCHAL